MAAFTSAILISSMAGTFVPVSAAGPLEITNVDSPDPLQTGDIITYTITITNGGGASVNNTVLTDQINGVVGFGVPALLDVTSTRGSCTQTNTQVTCSAGTIGGRGAWIVTIRGKVTAPGGTTINNIATVVATKSAQSYTSTATATTLVQGTGPGGNSPDLTIAKNGPLAVTPGGTITYTMTVNNIGTANAVGVKVMDTLPAGVTIGAVTATSLFACSVAAQTVTCVNGRVNAGSNATITVDGTIALPSGSLENTSVVDPDDTIDEGELGNTGDAAELNNTSNTVVTLVSPVPPPPPPASTIAIDKTGPLSAVPGEVITYTIVVTNGSLGRADEIVMTDGTQGLQAASLSVVSATATSGQKLGCTVSGPTVSCSITHVGTGGKLTVVIRGMVIASAGSTIINTATVNANIRNKGYTTHDEVQTIINAGIDLTITKSDSPDPVCAGSFPVTPPPVPANCTGGLTYTFHVGNSGVITASNVRVRDQLPPGTTYDDAATDAANGNDWCDESSPGVVTCIIPTLGPGSTQIIRIVLVAPAVPGTITNTVAVDPNNAIFEADESNNIAIATTTVATGIDLTIVKVDSPPGFDPIATSGTQTYTITVDNPGTQDVSGIRVRDTLPAGTTFLSATADNGFTCSHSAGIVECVGGSIHGTLWESYLGNGPDDATIIIRIRAIPIVGIMHNEVRVDPLNEIVEFNESNNIEFEDTVVTTGGGGIGAFNELSITKSSNPASLSTSTPVTYTITVTNTGTDPAVNVVVRDTLPAGFVYISAVDGAPGPLAFLCAPAGGNVVDCNGATIPGLGGVRTINITAFTSSAPGVYTNQAIVDPSNAIPEGNETNNAASAQTTVTVGAGFIDLSVKKCDVAIVVGCAPPAAPATKDTGALFTYFLEVTNSGTNPAFNVLVQDVLPVGVSFVSAMDDTALPGDFICSGLGFVVTCNGGTLDGSLDLIPGVPTTRTISIVVRAPDQHNVTIINQAFIDPGNTIAESNETNNRAIEVTSIQSPFNLKLDKDGPDQAHQNDEEDYVITVTNLGAAVNDVVVVDALPVGLIPLSITATPSNFICEFTENPVNGVRCVGDMGAAGAADNTDVVTITIHVFVTQDGGPLDNEACVDPDNDVIESNEGDNCDTKTTEVVTFSPNLSVQKSGPSSASAGETITYEVTVSNIGDANAAEPVTITDALPDAVSIVGTPTASNGFVCTHDGSATGGDVTCTDPTDGDDIGLAVGSFTQITIQATVSNDADTPFTNTASVPGGTAFDPNSAPCDTSTCENETAANNGNNSDSVTTSVGGSAIDLVMGDITDVFDPSNIGDSLTYTFTVTNSGPQDALAADGNEVVIRVNMPTVGVTFTSGIASQGFVCVATNTNALLTCTGDLDAGESTTATIEFAVSAATPPKLTLDATVDPDDDIVETNEANNFAVEDTTVNTAACNTCIDLVMGQIFASPNPAEDGGQTTYSFTVTNIGDLPTLADSGDNDVQIRIDLDTIFEDSTYVSFTATAGFSCSQPFLLDIIPSTDILCVNTTTGLNAGQGTLITITVDVDTASTPSFIDFDVSVDPADIIEEDPFEFNNTGGLRIDVVAP